MNKIAVSFLYFDGCPGAPRARLNLKRAVQQVRQELTVAVEEVDIMNPGTPDGLKLWGSPTILVNGTDSAGEQQGAGCSCRIYTGEEGVPSTRQIVEALKKGRVE